MICAARRSVLLQELLKHGFVQAKTSSQWWLQKANWDGLDWNEEWNAWHGSAKLSAIYFWTKFFMNGSASQKSTIYMFSWFKISMKLSIVLFLPWHISLFWFQKILSVIYISPELNESVLGRCTLVKREISPRVVSLHIFLPESFLFQDSGMNLQVQIQASSFWCIPVQLWFTYWKSCHSLPTWRRVPLRQSWP